MWFTTDEKKVHVLGRQCFHECFASVTVPTGGLQQVSFMVSLQPARGIVPLRAHAILLKG
jgi:hypothetical protein